MVWVRGLGFCFVFGFFVLVVGFVGWFGWGFFWCGVFVGVYTSLLLGYDTRWLATVDAIFGVGAVRFEVHYELNF